jgi:uncharacterized protein (TIGR02001 family)
LVTLLLFACALPRAVRAETTDPVAGSIELGARGGPVSGGPAGSASFEERAAGAFEFSARAGVASDYIYRGTTLSDHKPAAGAAFETAFDKFYAGSAVASVVLPSQPAAELTFSSGLRPKLGGVDFDLGWTYFAYPGELYGNNTDYWETTARADTKIGDLFHVAGGFAYSPNVSNTGAWSKYAAFGVGLEMPKNFLPKDITAALTGGAGYSWFGNQKSEFGGFPLPAYLNWNLGVTFGSGKAHFDLRYYDTNLTKENCFVYTGDPRAKSGGQVDPTTNPDGLVSRWCSATLVAKLWFALN